MKKEELAIATISWARNKTEEEDLRASLGALAKLSLPVFVTDGGSSEEFVNFLTSFPQFTVLSAKGLWPQAKQSLVAARDSGAATILYTEPDKLEFFQRHLPDLLLEARQREQADVLLAARSPKGMSTFPAFQQMTETSINNCCNEVIGKAVDYCYGPFLFSSQLVDYLDALPDNCGWGWRPFLFATAHRLGLAVEAFGGDFTCPPDQQTDDASERIYRMNQLAQNLEGLVLATTTALP
jgi:hypothetical protein